MQLRVPFFEVRHALAVDLYRRELYIRIFQQKLGQNTHSGTDLQYAYFFGTWYLVTLSLIGGLSNPLGDIQVLQEVLTKKFFGMYSLHFQGDSRPY